MECEASSQCHSDSDINLPAAPSSSDGDGDDGRQRPDGRRVVFLHPHQPPQDVVAVSWPRVHVRVLQPVGNVTLRRVNGGRTLSFWAVGHRRDHKRPMLHRCGGGSASTLTNMISKLKWFPAQSVFLMYTQMFLVLNVETHKFMRI